MNRLKHIVEEVEFNAIWEYLHFYYPDLGKLKSKYFKVPRFLKEIEPNNNRDNSVIHIDKVEQFPFEIDESSNQEPTPIEYRVHGKDDNPEWDGYIDIS